MARKMKDSGIEWIGEIPEGWEVIRLKYLADFEPTCDTSYLTDESKITYTPMECVKNGGFENRSALYGNLSHTLTPFQNGDIAMAKVTPCFENGNIAIMNNLFSGFGLGSSELFIFRPKSISTRYFFYWLQNKAFVARACSTMTGTGGLKRISPSFIRNCPVHYPSTDEQTKISDYLDAKCSDIDVILSKTRSSIEEYKKLKQAVITQAVTKGVRGEREMKDSGVEWIGEIPKEWVCEKIKYATSISRGLFNHRPRNDERYYNGKYPFIQTSDVANATKYIVSYSQTLNELGKSVSKEFPKGTLTMTIAANVGDVAILNFDAYFPDSVVGFIPNKNIRTLYLFYVFSAMKDEFTRTAIKNTQLNLNIDRVKETFIPVTLDSNEQCEIENYLESKCAEIDGLIAKKEQLVKELESYKKSLIYEVVTGKREV